MADQIIQEIYSQVQSKKKILATPPQEDAPSVDIANIRMPTPPSYKVGDKVLSWLFCEVKELAWGWFFSFLRSKPRCLQRFVEGMSQWQRGKLRLLSAPDGRVRYLQGLREGKGLTFGHTVSF